jgi:hypothetical protein
MSPNAAAFLQVRALQPCGSVADVLKDATRMGASAGTYRRVPFALGTSEQQRSNPAPLHGREQGEPERFG